MIDTTHHFNGTSSDSREVDGMVARPIIFLVDPDPDLGNWLDGLVNSVGGRVSRFGRVDQLTAHVDPERCGCLIVGTKQGEGGAVVLRLRNRGYRQPVLVLAEDGTIADAVSAIKAGAHDFLLKPPNGQVFLEVIQSAWRSELERVDRDHQIAAWRKRFAQLSPREHEVLRCIIRGLISKEIGNELGISARTVDAHRSAILRKLGGARISELVGMYLLIFSEAMEAALSPA